MKEHLSSSTSQDWTPQSAYASWRAMVRKVDTFHGVNGLRTLAGLDSWSHRWTFARFLIESRLGIPYRGALAPTETSARIRRNGYEFEPREGTTDREVLGPYNEVQTRQFILRHFSDKPAGGVFVDVGAHCGSFSILFESVFDRVLAVEPVPDNYRAMQRNIALNELQRKIHPFNVAAGATHAQGTLFVDKDDTSSLVPMAGSSGTLSVTIRPLDDLLSDNGVQAVDVRLLKADVEGAELEVLAGAQRLLEEGSPVVVLEANTVAAKKELESFMGGIGYVLVREADGRNLCFERFPERSLLRVLAFGGRFGAMLLKRRSA
jgi:FkbM family methyltransferase